MQLYAWSLGRIETAALPGPSAVICMADSVEQLANIKDQSNVVARLDLIFNDTTEEFGGVRPPSAEDAHAILQFFNTNRHLPYLVAQCQIGVGRSQAVLAALLKINASAGYKNVLSNATYNRRLYKQLLAMADVALDPAPLVSIAIRIKYAADRLHLFILCMQRQRYDNWELVAVTDGPNEAAARLVADIADPRIRLIETERRLGRWGHPYRQRGLDACRGEFIGMSNDDNYYVPGYIEQMVNALDNADVAFCQALHSNSAWSVERVGIDLGCWLARASLVRQLVWPGNEYTSDQDYMQALAALAPSRVAAVTRPLFIHN